MSKRAHRDLLAEHQEWIDHQYNDPYWVNRISLPTLAWWRWARKHHRAVGLTVAAAGSLLLLAMWPATWSVAAWMALAVPVGVLGAGLALFFQAPVKAKAPAHKVRRKHRH